MRVKWSGASSWMRSAQEGDVEQARMGNSHSTRSQHTVTAHGARSRKNDVESAGPVLCCLGTPSLERGRRYRFSQPIRASFTWVDLLSSGHRTARINCTNARSSSAAAGSTGGLPVPVASRPRTWQLVGRISRGAACCRHPFVAPQPHWKPSVPSSKNKAERCVRDGQK